MVQCARSSWVAAVSVAALFVLGSEADGQDLAGIVRNTTRGDGVAGAIVTMQSVVGDSVLATARSDSSGRFSLPLRRGPEGLPVILITQRLGFKPDTVRLVRVPGATFEIFLQDVAQSLDAREISAPQTRNQQAYEGALRRGQRAYGPDQVAEYRERAGSMPMLMRMLSVPGLIFATSEMDCIRSIRNQNCVTIVVDGVITGTTGYINPIDIDVLIVLSQTESRIEFGERAPHGAIVIYTREGPDDARSDRRRPRR